MVKLSRPTLVIVEDDQATRTLLRRMLNLCGWEVREAGTVAEGLGLLEPPPDCLVLDLGLPDGSGETLLGKVRAEGLPTRVVVHTGVTDPRRLQAIAADVVGKPLDSKGLRTICGACDAPGADCQGAEPRSRGMQLAGLPASGVDSSPWRGG